MMESEKNKVFVVVFLLFFGLGYTQKGSVAHPWDFTKEVNNYVEDVMDRYAIPGLALAIVQDNEVVYRQFFGKASLEEGSSVDETTLFRIFSTTKLFTATAIFRLVEDGKLNLEDRLVDHLSHLPEHWGGVRVKNLLSHSSGLPDMIRFKNSLSNEALLQKLSETKMEFETGSRFSYNQTNFWLLAQIIEKISKVSFETYVLDNQFHGLDDSFLFSSNSLEQIPNRAIRYFFNPKTKTFVSDTNNNGKRAHSGNGGNITLDAFIHWNHKLDIGHLIKEPTKSKMWEPFSFTNQKDEFLHGWGRYKTNGLASYGFTGGNLSAFRKFPSQGITVILLSNGYRIPVYDMLINDIARMVIPDLERQNLVLEHSVIKLLMDSKWDEALTSYNKLKEENPKTNFDNLRSNVNTIGNSLVRENNVEKAFQVFQWNAKANPEWWIAIAGLAEAYEMKGIHGKAIKYYEKAIRLNPGNEYGYNEIMSDAITKIKKTNQ